MNLSRVIHILGLLLMILAGSQCLPLAWCMSGDEPRAVFGFVAGAGTTALLGLTLWLCGRRGGELYRREGVLIVVAAWVLASLTGAIPYVVSGAIPDPVDALFESASGFTTTGASILVDVEALGPAVLFWRSLTQWLGGIGIVVLFVALLSELGPGARFLFKLEVPGPRAEVLHAHVRETAIAVSRIYLSLTLAQVLLMLALGAGLYAALTHTFSTVSTGGFSPYADSVARLPLGAQWVVMLFMIAAAVNFSLYYGLAIRRDRDALRDPELKVYGVVLAAAMVIVGIDHLRTTTDPLSKTLFDATFSVASVMTTTGFATADFSQWPSLSRGILVGLMIVGGCAGSTAGGAKVVRFIVGWRAAIREVRLTFSPNSVIAVVTGRVAIPEESVRSVVSLLLLWVLAWGAGSVLLSVGDIGLTTASTAAIATLSNIGPGLAAVGPTENFSFFAPWQKLVMVALMWLGRLEFFAILSLFQRQFWRH